MRGGSYDREDEPGEKENDAIIYMANWIESGVPTKIAG